MREISQPASVTLELVPRGTNQSGIVSQQLKHPLISHGCPPCDVDGPELIYFLPKEIGLPCLVIQGILHLIHHLHHLMKENNIISDRNMRNGKWKRLVSISCHRSCKEMLRIVVTLGTIQHLVLAWWSVPRSHRWCYTVDAELSVWNRLAQNEVVALFRCWKRGDLLSKGRSKNTSEWREWKKADSKQ